MSEFFSHLCLALVAGCLAAYALTYWVRAKRLPAKLDRFRRYEARTWILSIPSPFKVFGATAVLFLTQKDKLVLINPPPPSSNVLDAIKNVKLPLRYVLIPSSQQTLANSWAHAVGKKTKVVITTPMKRCSPKITFLEQHPDLASQVRLSMVPGSKVPLMEITVEGRYIMYFPGFTQVSSYYSLPLLARPGFYIKTWHPRAARRMLMAMKVPDIILPGKGPCIIGKALCETTLKDLTLGAKQDVRPWSVQDVY